MKYPCRLDKYLSHALGQSRNQIKLILKQGSVSINAEVSREGKRQVSQQDQVSVNGKAIRLVGHRYYLLYKPSGYVSTREDPTHPSALELITNDPRPLELHCAGRLDQDTTGLLLITSDGQWSHRVTHPRRDKLKSYRVSLAAPLSLEDQQQLESGVLLNGEDKPTKPAKLKLLDEQLCEIRISEGRYHQVKRMFAAVGNKVVALHRFAIGELCLDGDLAEGESRALSQAEIDSF